MFYVSSQWLLLPSPSQEEAPVSDSAELNPDVARVLRSYPPTIRARLLDLRALILETAAATEGVGPLTETLKWGEPAYLTEATGSGTTIRIAWKASAPTCYALCVHCQTTLIGQFRTLFADALRFDGNRAVVFEESEALPEGPVSMCIAMALTYHLDRKRGAARQRRAASA